MALNLQVNNAKSEDLIRLSAFVSASTSEFFYICLRILQRNLICNVIERSRCQGHIEARIIRARCADCSLKYYSEAHETTGVR